MKAISLWQVWASLLVHGKKRIETRSWYCDVRGWVAIHAAKKWDGELRALRHTEPFISACREIGIVRDKDIPFGAVVGLVRITECYRTEEVVSARWKNFETTERYFGDYSPGRFAILCDDFIPFPQPIPCAGRQKWFQVDDELIRPHVIAAGRTDEAWRTILSSTRVARARS